MLAFRELSAPITVHWEVTEACNKRCAHCYNYWRGSATRLSSFDNRFSNNQARAIVADLLANRVMHVIITGGEPLLVLDRVLPYVAQLTESGTSVSLNSNLMGLTAQSAQSIRHAGVKSVLCSLPASNPAIDVAITKNPDSFKQTIKGLEVAIRAGLNVSVNMVITRLNLKDIQATADLATRLGVRRMSVTRGMRPANATEADFAPLRLTLNEFRQLPRELQQAHARTGIEVSSIEGYPLCGVDDPDLRDSVRFNRTCRAGKTFLALSMDRSARACILLQEKYEGDLASVWKAMAPFRDISSLLPTACRTCPSRANCGGGCRAEALHESGDVAGLDPYAEPARMHASLPRWSARRSVYLDPSTRIHFHSELRGRPEPFGGLLFLDPQRMQTVGSGLFAFWQERRNGLFSPAELARVLEADESAVLETLSHLAHRGLLGTPSAATA